MFDNLANNCQAALKELRRAPFFSICTISVVSALLAMILALGIILQNVQAISHGWDHAVKVIIYLETPTDGLQARQIFEVVQARSDVEQAVYIAPEQGIQDLTQHGEFSEVLARLPSNPLPGVIEVIPADFISTSDDVQSLINNLRTLPRVADVQFDMKLFKRQQAWDKLLLNLVFPASSLLVLISLFSISVLMQYPLWRQRLADSNRGAGNKIANLTTNYLLPLGCFIGIISALIALLVIKIILATQSDLLLQLTSGQLIVLDFVAGIKLVLIGAILGVLGAWVGMGLFLRSIRSA